MFEMFKNEHFCEQKTGVRITVDERKREITRLVYDKGRVSVKDLAKTLYVTEMTIRRDLTELERMGYIKRYRGGAVPVQTEGNLPAEERFFVEEEEKKALGLKASKYLGDNMNVFIDSSTTCQYVIPHIAKYDNIKVFTNSVGALMTASRYNIPCTLSGGDYYQRDRCLVGPVAILQGGSLNVDVLFFSALGITEDGIISDNDLEQCAVRQAVMKNADKVVCLMEKGKVGAKYLYTLCKKEDITVIFPD